MTAITGLYRVTRSRLFYPKDFFRTEHFWSTITILSLLTDLFGTDDIILHKDIFDISNIQIGWCMIDFERSLHKYR